MAIPAKNLTPITELPDWKQQLFQTAITRIELAKAIKQCFVIKEINIFTTQIFPIYKDTQNLNSEEIAALNFVYNTSIMKGEGENFYPNKPTTRAELAAVMKRTLSILLTIESPQK